MAAQPFPSANPGHAAPAAGSTAPDPASTTGSPNGSTGLGLVLAPQGLLSGDGQLRELIQEQRARKGAQASIWYLPPALVRHLGLGPANQETVATADAATLAWLQLRFGGAVRPCDLRPETLAHQAAALPPAAPLAAVGLREPGRT